MTKKFISFALAFVLAAIAMSAVVFAADEPDAVEEIPTMVYDSYGENANISFQTGSSGTASAVGLKPKDTTTPEGAWFEYGITIPANCQKVTIDISYSASSDRYMDLTLNDETHTVTCPSTGDWNTFSMVTDEFGAMDAGRYVIRIAAPANFDNDTVKTPNVDWLTVNYYLAEGETLPVKETEAQTEAQTDAPETDAKTDKTDAPAENNGGSANTSAAGAEAAPGGCGSLMSVPAAAAAVTAVLGCCIVRRRK